MKQITIKKLGWEFSAIITIAYRDFTKLLRDRPRLLIGFIFPLFFVGILGTSLDASLGQNLGFTFLPFIFVGVFIQSLFQSSTAGLVSLIEDRENDFSQELFIAPVSRYSIIIGKILGETLVAYTSGIGILILGLILGVHFSLGQLVLLLLAGLAACLFGGAFGVLILPFANSQRTMQQIFPFILFPQIFLAGVFNPIDKLPFFLIVLSRLSPLTYAVDLGRNAFYAYTPEAGSRAVAFSPFLDMAVMGVLFLIFLILGTIMFIRKERNR